MEKQQQHKTMVHRETERQTNGELYFIFGIMLLGIESYFLK